jgi:regulatory protein
VSEVRAHLTGHGLDAEVADAVVEELIEQGALDDERFARVFVQDKRALEQWGAERIGRGLAARGIDRELADAALAERSDDDGGDGDDERDRALALLHHRFPVPPRERRDRERALGVLLRKGYEYELALEALERHCSVHG